MVDEACLVLNNFYPMGFTFACVPLLWGRTRNISEYSMLIESIVSISGSCNVANIVGHRIKITEVLKNSKSLKLDCRDIDHVDVSFVQLLISTQTTFRKHGLAFEIIEGAEPLRAAIARAGFVLDEAGQISSEGLQ